MTWREEPRTPAKARWVAVGHTVAWVSLWPVLAVLAGATAALVVRSFNWFMAPW